METRQHIVRSFDEALRRIESMIMEMGGLVEAQISDAADALEHRDLELGARVRENDKQIDRLNARIDEEIVRVLALRQPVAEDLRFVVGGLKIAATLERIGDYAKNIAKRNTVLAQTEAALPSTKAIGRMSQLVREMVHDVLDAYIARDLQMAEDVRSRDHEVDQVHNGLFRELLTYMMENPRNITPCMHLLFISKNIERMGDHATGIAEQVQFLITGSMPDEDRPKGDATSFASPDLSPGDGAK